MDTSASNKLFFIFLLSYTLMVCSSGSKRVHGRRELIQTTQHDTINPPFTASPVTNPVTTPATGTGTYPPDGLTTPPLVTVPSANPGPIPPATDPTINPVPIPPTNPVTNPVPIPPATDPTINPPFTGGGVPAAGASGQSWCVARSGVPETVIQVALDYACGMGGADCSGIQQGGACYNPNSLQNHASYAFNSYYQKNPQPTSCDFGGAAMLTNTNPSSGSCIFPTSSSSSSSSSASPATVSPPTTGTSPMMPTPMMPTPMMPTPGTDFSSGAAPGGFGTPPTVMNASNPALGGGIAGFGETPPTASISSASATTAGFIACITLSLSVILHARL